MKSHVSLEQRVCVVCAKAYETGAVLLDRRLQASMDQHTTAGWGLCPEHQRLHDQGFIALIECDRAKSGVLTAAGGLKLEEAWRTGQVAHPKRNVFAELFTVPVSADESAVFVDVGVLEQLQARVRPH